LDQLVASGFDIGRGSQFGELYRHIVETMNSDGLETTATPMGSSQKDDVPCAIGGNRLIPLPRKPRRLDPTFSVPESEVYRPILHSMTPRLAFCEGSIGARFVSRPSNSWFQQCVDTIAKTRIRVDVKSAGNQLVKRFIEFVAGDI